ncbi:hypothetical protein [Bdellovibrio sp. BCCA]|uniref:hypothetical protein n=1 Tax=Bdellovibrio sp. BCCA TaxID=3136281 RepID=UPI0030F3015B
MRNKLSIFDYELSQEGEELIRTSNAMFASSVVFGFHLILVSLLVSDTSNIVPITLAVLTSVSYMSAISISGYVTKTQYVRVPTVKIGDFIKSKYAGTITTDEEHTRFRVKEIDIESQGITVQNFLITTRLSFDRAEQHFLKESA